MKQVLQPDHIPLNNFQLRIRGMPALTLIECSGIEEEIDMVDLPDRTKASGGHSKAFEFTFSIPTHHRAEVAACKLWFESCQEPVAPNYKKQAVLIKKSISTMQRVSYLIEGMWLSKWKNPDNDMNNEGELDKIEFTACGDNLRLL